FIQDHHEIYLGAPTLAKWGNPQAIWPLGWQWGDEGTGIEPLLDELLLTFESDDLSEKQRERWEAFRDNAIAHRPGAPMARPLEFLLLKLLESFPQLDSIKFDRKEQEFSAPQRELAYEITRRLINAELENLLSRTRGIFQVIQEYERSYGQLVRRRGKLTFGDLLIILTNSQSESGNSSPLLSQTPDSQSRLNIDYRLDGRYDHWLLDEFQDTNFLQWRAMENLIDETVQDSSGQRTLFQVGDVKQAIYGWRGGDVRLFDEIYNRYQDESGSPRLKKRHLDRSFRSGPDIIGMVNHVFGDGAALSGVCPPSTQTRWTDEWRDHISNFPDRDGYACLLNPVPGDGATKIQNEDLFKTMLSVLEEIRPDLRGISCAVLVQSNTTASAIVDYVRAHSEIPIYSESDLSIATDNPLSLALLGLFQFAAHPGDSFAWQHLQMTPFGPIMQEANMGRDAVAGEILSDLSHHGAEHVIQRWLGRLGTAGVELDGFSRRRADEFAHAAQSFDIGGSKNIEEFLSFAENYTLREPAADGTVQVMTIHKSKGLGFDLAVLPELGGKKLALERDGIATQHNPDRSIDWVFNLPKKEIARQDPVLAEYIEEQEADNCYEALCKFYVAMTRAKRAMYLIAPPHGKSKSANFLKLLDATLKVADPTPGSHHDEIAFASGNPEWFEADPIEGAGAASTTTPPAAAPGLAPEASRRQRHRRRTPSGDSGAGELTSSQIFTARGSSALNYGSLVHALYEQIEWLDEISPEGLESLWDQQVPQATPEMRAEVLGSLAAAAPFLERPSASAACWREKRFETLLDGDWISGTIDRVVLDGGRATIVDFKTTSPPDGDATAKAAAEKHRPQLEVYRKVVQRMTGYPPENIRCFVFLTKANMAYEI
ncbi:MAG: UvrD-helicase domain-containing protein, partial [Verrucomicrobiales bacterium]